MPPPGDDGTGVGVYAHSVMTTDPPQPDRHLVRWIVVAGLAALAVGGMMALNFAAPTDSARWERTFTATPNLRVAGDARISVETSDRDDITVSLDADWYGHRSAPSASVDGDTLVLRACDDSFWQSFYWHAHCSADFVIRVPKGMALTARSDRGRAEATGTYAALDIQTDSGRIEVADATSPKVRLRADSGSITFSGTAPSAEIRTDSGSVTIDATTTDLSARTDSGSITADLRGTPNHVKASTDSGSISMTVPLTGYRITTSTDSGRQDIDPRLSSGTSARTIDLSTDSGSITLQGSEAP